MSTAPTQPDASPYVSPGDSNQSSGAIVPIAGRFDGKTEASDNTEAAVQRTAKGGSLLSTGKQRGSTMRALEMPPASLSSPETIAEHLLEAVRVEGSGAGTADSPLLPEHWIDTAMVAELAEHARKLFKERARQESESGGGGSGGASGGRAEEARTAAVEGKGEDGGGEGTSSRSSSSRTEAGVAPFEVAIGGGESDGTAKESQATSAEVPWTKSPDGKPAFALRKRPGRVVKLVPVEEDTKGSERSKDGSIILRDETMLLDRIYACSPCLQKCIVGFWWLAMAVFGLSSLVAMPALPFAILKFTNTTDVLFEQHVVNASSTAASAVNISNTNTTSDYNRPPW